MSAVTSSPEFRKFLRTFERSSVSGVSGARLFEQWLEASWAFCNAVVDREGFRRTLDRYSAKEGAEFGEIFFNAYIPLAERADWEDVLGPAWMLLTEGRQGQGQVFTPWSVASMMARMTFDRASFEQEVEAKGHVTVHDPCCGSGIMFLAFADTVRSELGVEAVGRIRFYGQDIDQRCIWMSQLQLRVNGLDEFGRSLRLASGLVEAARRLDAKPTTPRLFTPVAARRVA